MTAVVQTVLVGPLCSAKEIILTTFSSLSFPLALVLFVGSLGITMCAAAWFTRRLESICDRLDLSVGVLSLLGALGANIPNYVASIDALAHQTTEVGLGIIVGSNVYNIAVILGLATFFLPGTFRFAADEGRQIQVVGCYTLLIMASTLLIIWMLPRSGLLPAPLPLTIWLLIAGIVVTLGTFVSFAWHLLHRPHPTHARTRPASQAARRSLLQVVLETVLALALTLGGVVVMVQTGQQITSQMHLAPALAGLLVLAVATSLPNTVVALTLVRTGRVVVCVEELFSSNSINATLGIALPLLFWRQPLSDPLLLTLDTPLMVLLVCGALGSIWGHLRRITGVLFLLSYGVWVGVHVWR